VATQNDELDVGATLPVSGWWRSGDAKGTLRELMAESKRLHGVLVIDKAMGPTSHDVVARMRKVLGTRAVGHAGTLDPAATGVLVIAVGEATKLSPHLTADDKEYLATVSFGTSTTTLDAEGDVSAEGSIPDELAAELSRLASIDADPIDGAASLRAVQAWAPAFAGALEIERAREEQVPPAFSAIKLGGHAAHRLARRGEDVVLAPRPVAVKRIAIAGATSATVRLTLVVSKGYYVRALARDLGRTLGVPAHLASLRRVASGTFTLDEALPWSAPRADLERAMQTLEHAARRVLPASRLSEEGARHARHGKAVQERHFTEAATAELSAWFGPSGELVAIGRRAPDGGFAVERGFNYATSIVST
jgi:tRNA pseudouridine55 synthase